MQNSPDAPVNNELTEFDSRFPYPEELKAEPFGPNNPPWNSGIAFAVWVASVLLVVFIPSLFLLPYIFSKMGGTVDQTQLAEIATKDPTAILIQVAAILPVHLLTLLICWYVVTNFRKFPFRETLGWQSGGMRWWHHLIIQVSFFALIVLVSVIFPPEEHGFLRMLKSSKAALYSMAALAVLTAPLVEEVVYRGVLYSAFQRSTGTAPAVVLVTFLFALVHVPQYYESYSTIFLLTLLSLILTLVRVYSNNLLPCILIHTIFNGFQSLLLLFGQNVEIPGTAPVEPAAAILHFLQ